MLIEDELDVKPGSDLLRMIDDVRDQWCTSELDWQEDGDLRDRVFAEAKRRLRFVA